MWVFEAAELLKSASAQIQDGTRRPNWMCIDRNNSAADCSISLNFSTEFDHVTAVQGQGVKGQGHSVTWRIGNNGNLRLMILQISTSDFKETPNLQTDIRGGGRTVPKLGRTYRAIIGSHQIGFTFQVSCSISKEGQVKGKWGRKFCTFSISWGVGEMYEWKNQVPPNLWLLYMW